MKKREKQKGRQSNGAIRRADIMMRLIKRLTIAVFTLLLFLSGLFLMWISGALSFLN